VRQYWESLTSAERAARGLPSRLLTTDQISEAVVRLAEDRSLAGRVLVWWSENAPRLIEWGDKAIAISASGHRGHWGLVNSVRNKGPSADMGASDFTNAGTSSFEIQTWASGGCLPKSGARRPAMPPITVLMS
jgi:hypothetical protein